MNILQKIESILQYLYNIICVFTSQNKKNEEHKKDVLNKKFNLDIEKSKSTSFCDALRKEKQQKIEEIKNA